MKRLWCACTLTSARSTKKNVLGFSASEFSVSRIRVSLGTFILFISVDPKLILTNHLLFVVLNFRWFLVRVVLKRRRRKDGPVVCVSFWNNIQKKERERPQKRDRVVKGITALKTTNSEHKRSRERVVSSVVVFILWTTAFLTSQSAKRGTCAASHLNSFFRFG